MHPVIRILSLLAVLGYLSRADWRGIAVVTALLLTAYAVSGVGNRGKLLSMLARLRYFYLALFLVYGLSTPGEPLTAVPFVSFTREGLMAGLERVVGLGLIVAAVHWLLESTTRDDLAAGLYWLLKPLGALRVPVDRFVLRLVLTLERIEAMLEHAYESRRSVPSGAGRETLSVRAARLFDETLHRAEAESGVTVDLQMDAPPGRWQWVGWGLFVGLLFLLSQLRVPA